MTDGTTVAGRRARSRKGEGRRLRDDIMDATERLLLDGGSSDAVSIRAVADAVGVTAPSIYRHFADKATLIYEVCDRRCASLQGVMEQALEGIDDPIEGLRIIGRTYVEFGRNNPEPYRLVFMSRLTETPDQFGEERIGELASFGLAMEWVQKAIDAGRLRPEYDDATEVTTAAWAHAHGITSLLITEPNWPWPEGPFVESYLDIFVRGILAHPD